jgi:NADPH:quinone reductase-like Zn-dependent oxidoreductase
MAVGSGVAGLKPGVEVYGATNARFTGAYAEYALAEAAMIGPKPTALSPIEAASAPVVACTAYQMLFDHAGVAKGQTVVVLGGGGNVGAYAVRLALLAGAQVIATTRAHQASELRALGNVEVVAACDTPPEDWKGQADVVIDTVGGRSLAGAFDWLRSGGVLVSAVEEPDLSAAARRGLRAQFMLVSVTTKRLEQLGALFDAGEIRPRIGQVLSLRDGQLAHRMLEERTAPPGKLVLVPGEAGG